VYQSGEECRAVASESSAALDYSSNNGGTRFGYREKLVRGSIYPPRNRKRKINEKNIN
jgi:hypothetical protein